MTYRCRVALCTLLNKGDCLALDLAPRQNGKITRDVRSVQAMSLALFWPLSIQDMGHFNPNMFLDLNNWTSPVALVCCVRCSLASPGGLFQVHSVGSHPRRLETATNTHRATGAVAMTTRNTRERSSQLNTGFQVNSKIHSGFVVSIPSFLSTAKYCLVGRSNTILAKYHSAFAIYSSPGNKCVKPLDTPRFPPFFAKQQPDDAVTI